MGKVKNPLGWFNGVMGAASSLGDVATGIIGSLINRKTQRETNEFNERMQNQMNEFNAEQNQLGRDFSANEAQKARNFTVEMFNRENEYNDPSQQVKRYEAAGLNPAMMAGQISPGTASAGATSQASAPGVIPGQAFQKQPELLDVTGIQNAFANLMTPINDGLLAAANYNNTNTRTANLKLANDRLDMENQIYREFEPRKQRLLINQLDSLIKQTQGDTNYAMLDSRNKKHVVDNFISSYELDTQIRNSTRNNIVWNNRIAKAQEQTVLLGNKAQEILNKHLDDQQVAELGVKFGMIFDSMTKGLLSYRSAEKVFKESYLVDFDIKEREELWDSYIEAAKLSNIQSLLQTGFSIAGDNYLPDDFMNRSKSFQDLYRNALHYGIGRDIKRTRNNEAVVEQFPWFYRPNQLGEFRKYIGGVVRLAK